MPPLQLCYLGIQALAEDIEELAGCGSNSSSVTRSLSIKIEEALNSEGHNREELVGAVKKVLSESIAAVTVSSVMQLCQALVECTTSNRLVLMVHLLVDSMIVWCTFGLRHLRH